MQSIHKKIYRNIEILNNRISANSKKPINKEQEKNSFYKIVGIFLEKVFANNSSPKKNKNSSYNDLKINALSKIPAKEFDKLSDKDKAFFAKQMDKDPEELKQDMMAKAKEFNLNTNLTSKDINLRFIKKDGSLDNIQAAKYLITKTGKDNPLFKKEMLNMVEPMIKIGEKVMAEEKLKLQAQQQ